MYLIICRCMWALRRILRLNALSQPLCGQRKVKSLWLCTSKPCSELYSSSPSPSCSSSSSCEQLLSFSDASMEEVCCKRAWADVRLRRVVACIWLPLFSITVDSELLSALETASVVRVSEIFADCGWTVSYWAGFEGTPKSWLCPLRDVLMVRFFS